MIDHPVTWTQAADLAREFGDRLASDLGNAGLYAFHANERRRADNEALEAARALVETADDDD